MNNMTQNSKNYDFRKDTKGLHQGHRILTVRRQAAHLHTTRLVGASQWAD